MSCYLWGFGCMRDVPVKCLLHYWTQKNSIFIANWIVLVTKRENCLLAYSDEIISFKICILLSPPSLSKWKLSQYLHEPMNERSPDSFPCWRHLSKTKLNHVTLLLKNAHWLPIAHRIKSECLSPVVHNQTLNSHFAHSSLYATRVQQLVIVVLINSEW